MLVVESGCVGCPPELGCLGSACPYKEVTSYLCDACEAPADYVIDNEHFCSDCAEELINDAWDWLSLEEKGELLGFKIERLEDL